MIQRNAFINNVFYDPHFRSSQPVQFLGKQQFVFVDDISCQQIIRTAF